MASWEEVRSHLRAKYTLAIDTLDMVGMVFRFPVDAREIVQGVRISPVENQKEPWIALVADVCPEAQLGVRVAMMMQGELLYGGLIVRQGMWLFRHAMALRPCRGRTSSAAASSWVTTPRV